MRPSCVLAGILLLAVLSAGMAAATASAAEPTATTWVVDRDRVQCAGADFMSIQTAVNAAQPGDLIRVCPDLYSESVTVDKPLTLKGEPDAVEAVDCFDATPSQQPGGLDPTQQVIVDGSASTALASLTLAADDIELAGFVVQGTANPLPLPSDDHLFRRAIDVSGAYSGYQIHHNLLRLNTVGIMLGGSGARSTRFHHNCLRENTWGLAADYRDLIDARIDHNVSYYTASIAFELVRITYARAGIIFDHNRSRQDNRSYFIEGSRRSSIVSNTIESQMGITVSHSNAGLEISTNLVTDPFEGSRTGFVFQGIFFAAAPAGMPLTTGTLVSANTVTGIGTAASATGDAILAAGPPNFDRPAVANSQFLNNVTSDNVRYGIALRGDNNGNTVRGNVSERNGSFGIFLQGARDNILEANVANNNGLDGVSLQRTVRLGVNYDATDNTLSANVADGNGRDGIFADQFTARNMFAANQMLGNTAFDARDLAYAANRWLGNVCATDWPAGAICGGG